MTAQDFFITPLYLFFLLSLAYIIRPMVTNAVTKRYFLPGLLAKFVGAIALGLIYQLYYGGGDTFTYHTHGSRWIWKAFMDDPMVGLDLFFQKAGDFNGETFQYSSRIWMFRDKASMVIIRITALFDLLTFSTYSATALFFASFAFSGHWAIYSVLQKLYPSKSKQLALAILFIPSVIFWGSGILKDSVTLAALCWMTYSLFQITVFHRFNWKNLLILLLMAWIIFAIKIYILLCFLVGASLFMYMYYISKIRNSLVKAMVAPLLLTLFIGGGYFTMNELSEENERYSLDKIGETAMITAYDIRYGWGARHGDNSGYTLGELDGSIGSLIKLAPQGIIVTLFRPWLWEVKNPLMLLAALESLGLLVLTLYIIKEVRWLSILRTLRRPIPLFCLCFALMFAFAVGVSTYNFGTLMRYKIPVMPFYTLVLVLAQPSKQKKTNS
ncbi:hypothetical protein N6H18_03055 [Reichenbachiella agarivorans]|uniref:Glycosyltransferase RgtA/B/C/D-like domain-containing protein n=1 Tax=Reichenbachiella agarivorans TaxID=2979464 RepID=A0ABY6CTZ3_9BACT|nr:hypothetical protein [Reichenbachiella agarivorans]UXP32933.1 hypothetical protein N6H18_03055 [Reichenbachiella agarivorans]